MLNPLLRLLLQFHLSVLFGDFLVDEFFFCQFFALLQFIHFALHPIDFLVIDAFHFRDHGLFVLLALQKDLVKLLLFILQAVEFVKSFLRSLFMEFEQDVGSVDLLPEVFVLL